MAESALEEALRAAGCVFAEREAALIRASTRDPAARRQMVAQRVAGAPLEYVVGSAEFAGVRVRIGSPAFIPRHRAAVLVDLAGRYAPVPAGAVVDLGCGCGAIAAALVHRHPDWGVHATDVDSDALHWAVANAAAFGFEVHQGHWFDGLPAGLAGTVGVVVAHLPYVPTAEMTRSPRDFHDAEPPHTVDGGGDGLDPWRVVAPEAARWLAPAGVLLTQVAWSQYDDAVRIGTAAGLDMTQVGSDDDVVVLTACRA